MKRVIAGLIAAFAFGMFAHLDFYPSLDTYGWSFGTDTHYCSLDLVRYVPALSCESAE